MLKYGLMIAICALIIPTSLMAADEEATDPNAGARRYRPVLRPAPEKPFSVGDISQDSLLESIAPVNFVINLDNSPRMGAENLLFAWRSYDLLERTLIPDHIIAGDEWPAHLANGLFRGLKVFLIDYPWGYFTSYGVQHEFFGHNASFEYRSSPGINATIDLRLPPPFGSGFTLYTQYESDPSYQSTAQDDMMATGAGINADRVLANRLQRDALLRDGISPHMAMLFLLAENDFAVYVLVAEKIVLDSGSGDISAFGKQFPEYGRQTYNETGTSITNADWDALALADLFLDPFLYFNVYSLVVNYLILGDDEGPLYMVPIGPVGYLPTYYPTLTPYGTAHNIKNYLRWNRTVFDLTVQFPHISWRDFWGVSIGAYNLDPLRYAGFPSYVSFDLFTAFWQQPLLAYGIDGERHNKPVGAGGLAQLAIYMRPPQWERFALLIEMGYKSAGDWEGYFPGEGLLLQFGVSLR